MTFFVIMRIQIQQVQRLQQEYKMGKDNEQDEINLEQIQKHVKQKIFELTKCYLEHCSTINPLLIYLIILIECLQILWFSIHPQLTFLNDPFLLSYIRSALAYLNFQNFIQNNNALLFPFVLLASCIILVHVVTLVISANKASARNGQEKEEFMNVIDKIAAYQIVLINSVLFIPIYNVSIITLYCQQDSYYYQNYNGMCYDTLHIILCILSAINLIVLLASSLGYWFIFYVRNPFSKNYYAIYNNLFRLGKILLKILFPLYFLIDQKSSFQNVFVIVQLVLVGAYIVFFRINSIHNFYPNYFYCELFMQSLLLWFCISTAIAYRIQNSGMSFTQACLCSLVFAYTVCIVQAALMRRFFDSNISGNIKKQDREKFVYSLIHVLFKQVTENQISPLVYIKLLNANMNLCSLKISKYLKKGDLKTQQLTEITRSLLFSLLTKFYQDTPSINLKLVKSLILFDSGRRILSLHQMNQIRTEKLSIYEEFIIYYFKSTRNLYHESDRKNNSDDNIVQIHTYLEFTEIMNEFQYELENCAKNNEQFWEELCQDIPSTNKVFNLAEHSSVYANRVIELFKKLQAIFPENLACLFLYYQFLMHVFAKNKEHNKIKQRWELQRQRELKKQTIETEDKTSKIKYKANEKMCVLNVSTNSNNHGNIINCNSQVKGYLGYQKSELINQKVTKIMPKIYSEIHDQFIKNFLERADDTKLPVQKTVFAFKKNLKMRESYLAVKIFPNLATGFQMVGFFKQMSLHQYRMNIMVNMKTLQIEGMTEGFLNLADNRIKLQQIQKQPLRLSHLFPEIEPNHTFKVGEEINTLFRFSDCTDKLIEVDELSYQIRKKHDKQIILALEQINYYSNASVGIFTVDYADAVSLQDTSKKTPARIKASINKNNTFVARESWRKNTRFRQQNQREEVSLQRKMEDFMSSNSRLFQIFLIKILFFLCFVSLTIVSIFINIYENDSSLEHNAILSEIQLSNNISILQGKILTQNKLIFKLSQNPQKFVKQKNLYMQFLKQLQQTSTNLFQSSNENVRKVEDLVINQQKIYEFSMMPKNNISQIEHLHLYDGILQLVFIGIDLLGNRITDFQNLVSQEMKAAYFLIQQNMKVMLPSISESVTNAYSSYFSRYIASQMSRTIYFVSGKTTTYLLVYFLVCFAISKFMRFNHIFVEIYNSILKWDAHELYLKCHKFRTKSFEVVTGGGGTQTNIQEQKKSDVWKIFPRSLVIQLSQGKIRNDNNKKTSMNPSNLLHPQNHQTLSQTLNEQQQKQTTRKQKTSIEPIQTKIDYINIKLDITFKKKFITIFLLLLSLTCINYCSLFFKGYYNSKLDQQKQNSVNLGKYSKVFLYTLFYGTQIIQGQESYRGLYSNELNKFYDISTNVSQLIGDPNPYLRQVYRQIEIINSFVKGELSTITQSQKTNLIIESQHKLFELSDQINKFSRQNEANMMKEIESLQKIIKIVKIVLDVVITVIFCRLAQVYLLDAVEKQLFHSCNMLKMLPIWIIAKNKNIQNIIFSKSKLEPENTKTIHVQESAVNLIQASKFGQIEDYFHEKSQS